jgi:protein required for attachment to host cells
MNHSKVTWVLVGDSSGARIFKFDGHEEPWTMLEKVSGDNKGDQGTRDFGTKASEHKGALHGHGENKGAEKATAERRFAHSLAHILERGLSEGAFGKLVLVAEPKLLGELRENLSRGLKETVVAEMNKDYVHLGTEEIRKHVLAAMPHKPAN